MDPALSGFAACNFVPAFTSPVDVKASAASFGSSFLTYGGGVTGMYGLLAAYSTVTGNKLAFGSGDGVPLPSTWLGVGVLMVAAVVLYWLGTRWDRPGFVAVRKRRPWLVPTVSTFVVFPALLVLLFMMVQ